MTGTRPSLAPTLLTGLVLLSACDLLGQGVAEGVQGGELGVLGVRRDEFDVEYVQLYALIKEKSE